MWIKKPEDNYTSNSSNNINLNWLFNQDKFYFMDNHLVAAWCWLQKVDLNQNYNFLHIDQHYDLLGSQRTVKAQILDKGIDIPPLSLNDFLNLKEGTREGQAFPAPPIFRWDNYILNLLSIYPQLFNLSYFAVKDNGNNEGLAIEEELDIIDVPCFILDNIVDINANKWIVNIDIDYFFHSFHSNKYQYLSDEYILDICDCVIQAIDYIEVVTIALSPECCGGWDKSIRIANIMSERFGLNFKL